MKSIKDVWLSQVLDRQCFLDMQRALWFLFSGHKAHLFCNNFDNQLLTVRSCALYQPQEQLRRYCKGFPGELPVTESLWVVEPALEGIPLFKTLLQQSYEFGVAEQAPWSGVDEAGRYLAGETLDVQVGAEALQQVGHEIQVSVQGK